MLAMFENFLTFQIRVRTLVVMMIIGGHLLLIIIILRMFAILIREPFKNVLADFVR